MPRAAAAQTPPPEEPPAKPHILEAEGCPPDFVDDLERLTKVELRDLIAPDRTAIEIRIRCDDEHVTLEVTSHDRRTPAQRGLALGSTAESVRPRVVALALAELVEEQQAQAPVPEPPKPVPAPAPLPPPPPPPVVEPPPPVTPLGRSELFFTASRIELSNEFLWGGGVRLWYVGFAPLQLALDFSATTGGRKVALGSTRLVAAGFGARLGYALPLAAWELRFGLGQRAGMARISGDADAARAHGGSVVGAWTTSLGFLAVDVALGGAFRAGLGAELGYVLVPVHGHIEGHEDVGVDGLWASLELGISVGF